MPLGAGPMAPLISLNPMPIEEHVTSLELSRRLKELGVPQESLWYWTDVSGHLRWYKNQRIRHDLHSSAFLASELGLLLPQELDGYSWRQLKTPRKGAWEIKYRKREEG